MKYYAAGYYLMKIREFDFGRLKGKTCMTCSSCINDSLLDAWSFLLDMSEEEAGRIFESLKVDKEKQLSIQEWVTVNLQNSKLGWPQVFADIETVLEYREQFFSGINGLEVLRLYFPENERADLLTEFEPSKKEFGTIGLYDGLLKEIDEVVDEQEEFIGFDLIGVESSGDFHTFHCHDLASELNEEFGLELNEFGLIKEVENPVDVVEYMNDEDNGCEPVPWFLVMVKRVNQLNS